MISDGADVNGFGTFISGETGRQWVDLSLDPLPIIDRIANLRGSGFTIASRQDVEELFAETLTHLQTVGPSAVQDLTQIQARHMGYGNSGYYTGGFYSTANDVLSPPAVTLGLAEFYTGDIVQGGIFPTFYNIRQVSFPADLPVQNFAVYAYVSDPPSPATVPAPPVMFLLGTGLTGLVCFSRVRKVK